MQKQVLCSLIGQVSFVGGANAVKEPHQLRGRVTEVRVSGERDLNLFDDTCGFKWNSAQSRLQKFDMTSESEASLRWLWHLPGAQVNTTVGSAEEKHDFSSRFVFTPSSRSSGFPLLSPRQLVPRWRPVSHRQTHKMQTTRQMKESEKPTTFEEFKRTTQKNTKVKSKEKHKDFSE